MKKLLLIFVFVCTTTVRAGDPDVRGGLYRLDSRGLGYPASAVPVWLTQPQFGRTSTTYSDMSSKYGMFYFIVQPACCYTLWIQTGPKTTQTYGPFTVSLPLTDLPPIRVP